MVKAKSLLYGFVVLVGNGGFEIALYLILISALLWPPSIAINENILLQVLFYLLFPIISLSFIGFLLMLFDLFRRDKLDEINSRIWFRIFLSSWSFGPLIYYLQIYRRREDGALKSGKYRASEHVTMRVFLAVLYYAVIGSAILSIILLLFYYFTPLIKPVLFDTFWVYPLKGWLFFGLSWLTLYNIAVADRARRDDEDLRNIDPVLIDFPYILNVGKGLFKYYRKVLRA